MRVTEEQHSKDVDTCSLCAESGSEFLRGRCHQCLELLRLSAYQDSRDTDDYFWKDNPNGYDFGNWELKSENPEIKFEKHTFKKRVYYLEEGVYPTNTEPTN